MDPEGSLPRSHGPVNCSHPAPAETSLLSLTPFPFNNNYSIALLRVTCFKKNLNKRKLPPSAVHIIKENYFRSCCLQRLPSIELACYSSPFVNNKAKGHADNWLRMLTNRT